MTSFELTPVEPTPELRLKRLVSAMHLAERLHPDRYDEWAFHGPHFYDFSDGMGDFIDEEMAGCPSRTEREELALVAGGTIIANYWMDVFPGRGVPVRSHVEYLFIGAKVDEAVVVSPLVKACADDASNLLLDEQRERARNVTTFEGLEALIVELDPSPPIDDGHVHPRNFPISRRNIKGVLQPMIVDLSERLITEGHRLGDHRYLYDLQHEIDILKQQRLSPHE